jgi:predicted RNA binding protein YcfA (HicA-like mRNA interferase family)
MKTVFKVRDIKKALELSGWTLVASRGDHFQYKHSVIAGKVTVAGKNGDDVKLNNLKSMERQSGLCFRAVLAK